MCASLFDALRSSSPAGEKPDASPLPPLKESAGGALVPDYGAWCPDWWRGCFACPDFLRDRLRFCRKWNRVFHGAEGVDVVMDREADAAPEPDGGRSWWTYGRKSQRSVNTVDAKKGEVLTS